MSAPTTTNTLAGMVNSAISEAMSLGTDAVEAAIIADVPVLGYPGLKQILEWGLSLVEGYFYSQAANAATKLVIDLQVGSEISTVNLAFTNAQQAVASGDPQAIQKASSDLDTAFGNLVHSDGSASP